MPQHPRNRGLAIVIFGGTISMLEDADGNLITEPGLIRNLLVNEYGYDRDKVRSAISIDSIIFLADMHYRKMYHSVTEQLRYGNDVIISGGTDTIQYYAPLLANDLKNHYLVKDDAKVLFISSMVSFEDDKEHVKKIIESARKAIDELPGGGVYALSARDRDAKIIDVFSAVSGLVKTSSTVGAVKGMYKAAEIVDGHYKGVEEYKHPAPLSIGYSDEGMFRARVAPSLIVGNTIEGITSYLDSVWRDQTFDAVVIEGLPPIDPKLLKGPHKHASQLGRLAETIRRMNNHDQEAITVYVNHNVMYDHARDRFHTQDGRSWGRNPVIDRLEKAGAVILEDMTPNNAYLCALLNAQKKGRKKGMHSDPDPGRKDKLPCLGIRYAPFISFMDGLDLATHHTNHVVMAALFNNVLPWDMMQGHLKGFFFEGRERFHMSSDYNGVEHRGGPYGIPWLEGETRSGYAAGQLPKELEKMVINWHAAVPQELMRAFNAKASAEMDKLFEFGRMPGETPFDWQKHLLATLLKDAQRSGGGNRMNVQ